MFIKKSLLFLIVFFFVIQGCFANEEINAKNNAYLHNNKGLMYLNENYYFGAIKEFQIAIDLNPDSQASAIFYTNLGTTYEKLGYYDLAKPCFEKALKLNALSFEPYLKLAENYKKLNIVDEKLNYYIANNKSPLTEILIGLLYIQKGETSTGVTMLDEFCNKEPKLMTTVGVRNYLNKFTQD